MLFAHIQRFSCLTFLRSHPQSHPHYSVRLFCASSEHYRPPQAGYQSLNSQITNRNIPIEYPSNPDAGVDEHAVPFKERGLRGKAGSAPPLDLNKTSRGLTLSIGRLTTVVMGHTGPSVGKRKEQAKVRNKTLAGLRRSASGTKWCLRRLLRRRNFWTACRSWMQQVRRSH